jgi:hypothetical protein
MFATAGTAWADTPVLNPTGALTFTWHGSAGRGCRAAGVCGVSGSLDVIPQDQSGASESPRQRDIDVEDDNAVARVDDPGSSLAQPHICTDLVPVSLSLMIVGAHAGGLRAVISVPEASPSSGRCAGPAALDLDNFTLPARRLPGHQEAYDMSGTRTLGAGPYEVTIRSTVRARRPRTSPGGGGSSTSSSPGPRPIKRLLEQVSLQYRIVAANGTLTTSFNGRADPFCVPLDACGASGRVTDSISPLSRQFDLEAQRLVPHRVSGAVALRDLRSGRLRIFPSGAPLDNALSATSNWPGGGLCTDQLKQPDGLELGFTAARGAQDLTVGVDASPGGQDPLRSHCAGPAAADAQPSRIAAGSIALRDLGARHLRVSLSGRGAFVAAGYAGTRNATASVDLRLVAIHAGTQTTQVFPGLPVP